MFRCLIMNEKLYVWFSFRFQEALFSSSFF